MAQKPAKKTKKVKVEVLKQEKTVEFKSPGAVVKEFYDTEIDMRGPGACGAPPVKTGSICILRIEGQSQLSLTSVAKLFNAAAGDYPDLKPLDVQVQNDHIEFRRAPKNSYKKLPSKTIASRG